eukprot:2706133-Amphidinium_carterae.1
MVVSAQMIWKHFDIPQRNGHCRFNGHNYSYLLPRCTTRFWQLLCGNDKFILLTGGHQPLWQPKGLKAFAARYQRTKERKRLFVSYGHAFGTVREVSDAYLSHVVTMIRDPRQRAVSGWYNGKHD